MLNKIFYINSYDYDINIGRGYNEHIKYLPEDSWICIMDMDTMPLNNKIGHQLNDIINKHGKEYLLFGSLLSRIRSKHQLLNGKFDSDLDVRKAYKDTINQANLEYDTVEEVDSIAGCMMLFSKGTWTKVGGFKECDFTADIQFCESIKRIGKIGLMKGVYLFHAYRVWQFNHLEASEDQWHLQKINR